MEMNCNCKRLRDYPGIVEFFKPIYLENRAKWRNWVIGLGVPEEDADDIMQDAYIGMFNWRPKTEKRVGLEKEAAEGTLSNALAAIYYVNLRFKCGDHFRKRKKRIRSSIDDPLVQRQFDGEDRDNNKWRMIEFYMSFHPHIVVDVAKIVEEGDGEEMLNFYRQLCKKARLDEKEKAFILYMLKKGNNKDMNFDRSLSSAQISKIKKRAFAKLGRYMHRFFSEVVMETGDGK